MMDLAADGTAVAQRMRDNFTHKLRVAIPRHIFRKRYATYRPVGGPEFVDLSSNRRLSLGQGTFQALSGHPAEARLSIFHNPGTAQRTLKYPFWQSHVQSFVNI
jgi:hypothetical protein